MAQHDYVIANGTGAAVRSDLNNGLAAIVSNNSGATEPATMYAYQWWPDTTTGLLKIRNSANNAWVTVGTLASVNLGLAALASPTFTGTVTAPTFTASTAVNIPLGSAGSPTLFFTGDSNTGLFSPGADAIALATAGTNRLHITSGGNVGIGTTGPQASFVVSDAGANGIEISPVGGSSLIQSYNRSTSAYSILNYAGTQHVFTNGALERCRVDSSGRLLVGTSSAVSTINYAGGDRIPRFQVVGDNTDNGSIAIIRTGTAPSAFFGAGASGTNVASGNNIGGIVFTGYHTDKYYTGAVIAAEVDGTPGANDMPGRLVFSTTADGASSPTERMRITSAGSVLVGGAIPQGFGPSSGYMLALRSPSGAQTYLSIAAPGQTADTQGMVMGIDANDGYVLIRDNKPLNFSTNNIVRMTIAAGGSVSVVGALSKGSGSFRIDHPLPEKKDTHQLVHSFIEGPQADLIYRGHACLVNGKAQINIDEAAQMTEGTFEALCRDVCCFTTNESDWTPVRGSVTGNILIIEAQDPASCADVCWLVIGERKDQHMLDTDWTDENGKVITEPLKETSIPETA